MQKEEVESLPPTVLQIETVSNGEAAKIDKEIEERRRKSEHLFNPPPGHRRSAGRQFNLAESGEYEGTLP